jgi:hypothetical protein
LVELLAYGGPRVGEAPALRRRNVDVLGCKPVVAASLTEADGRFVFGSTKTHQVKEVPLPRSLLGRLERHLPLVAETDPMTPNQNEVSNQRITSDLHEQNTRGGSSAG